MMPFLGRGGGKGKASEATSRGNQKKQNQGKSSGGQQSTQKNSGQKPKNSDYNPAKKGRGGNNNTPAVGRGGNIPTPGNEQGFRSKQDPFVNFGPVLKEFLAYPGMVNKVISVEYKHDTKETDVTVGFRSISENGVTPGELRTLTIAEYLSEKSALLKQSDDDSKFTDWASMLLLRLGINLSGVKAHVSLASVQKFVNQHLGPIERTVLTLSENDWDTVDTNKLAEASKPTTNAIINHYGSVQGRIDFIKGSISGTDAKDLAAPNWAAYGLGPISKGTLLDSVRVRAQVTSEQKAVIASIAGSMMPSPMGTNDEDAI